MRAVIQRVMNASVQVDGGTVSTIGCGILALVGFHTDDTESDADYIIAKMFGLRIFGDENGVMNLSVADTGGEVLIVSQFTLYGDTRKGKRPSYSTAMPPERARQFYESFIQKCRASYERVSSGMFGADMQVSLVNSGPVTIILDSSKIL